MSLSNLKIFAPLVLLLTTSVHADPPSFEEPFMLEVNGEPLKTESPHYASPTMVDLDGDGLQDLVIGQFKNGSMIFLKNSGKAGSPEFKSKSWIMTDDARTTVPGVW